MKLAKKAADPTLHTINKAIDDGFGRIERRIDGVEQRLGMVEARMSGVEDTNRHLNRRMGEVETRLEGIQEDIQAFNESFVHETRRYVNHESRIAKLEKVRA